jgi:hypothetical protein
MPLKAAVVASSVAPAENAEPEVDPSLVTLRVKRDRRQIHMTMPAAFERRREWGGSLGIEAGSN